MTNMMSAIAQRGINSRRFLFGGLVRLRGMGSKSRLPSESPARPAGLNSCAATARPPSPLSVLGLPATVRTTHVPVDAAGAQSAPGTIILRHAAAIFADCLMAPVSYYLRGRSVCSPVRAVQPTSHTARQACEVPLDFVFANLAHND